MLKFTQRFLSFLLLSAAVTLVGCEKAGEEFDPSTLEFTVESVEGSVTTNSATIQATVAPELTLYYQCQLDSETQNEAEWKTMEGSTAPLTIKFENLTANSSYTASFYTMDASERKGETATVKFTTLDHVAPTVTATLSEESTLTTYTVSVEVSGDATELFSTLYMEGTDPSTLIWEQFPNFSGDNTYTFIFDDVNFVDGTKYIFECYAANEHKTGEKTSVEFTPNSLVVSNIESSSISVSFDLNFNTNKVSKVVYKAYNTSEYTEDYFLGEVTNSYNTSVTSTIGKHSNNPTSYLRHSNDYTLAVVPVTYDEATSQYTPSGDVQTFTFSTSSYIIGQGTATLPFTVDEIEEQGLNYTLDNSALECYRYFSGAIATKYITTTLEDYITENWINTQFPAQLFNFDYSTGTITGLIESLPTSVYSLAPNTEYELFTIAFDENYQLGPITSKKVTTASKPIDETLVVTSATATSVKPFGIAVDVTLGAGVSKTFYKLEEAGLRSDDDVYSELYRSMQWAYIYLEESGIVEHTGLKPNTVYNLYTLCSDAESAVIGPLQKFEFKTADLTPTAVGDITCVLTSAEIEPYGPGSKDRAYFEFTLTGDLTGAYIIPLNPSDLAEGIEPTLDNYIARAVELNQISSYRYKTAIDGTILNYMASNLTSEESVLVMIPLNDSGDLGQPALHTYVRPTE